MTKRLGLLAAATAGVLCLGIAAPAGADATNYNDSFAEAARVVPGSGSTPSVDTGGVIGGLLSPLTPALSTALNPLQTALSGLSQTIVSDLAALTDADQTASSGELSQPPPASGFPTCGTTGWDIGNCYGPTVPTVSAAPVLSLGTGTMQGFATADPTGSYAQAHAAHLQLSLLGIPIGDLGVADGATTCAAAGACTASATLADASLLGGQLGLSTASDGSLQVSIAGAPAVALSTLTSPVALSVAGLVSATVQANGDAVGVQIGLTLGSLLSALGLPDVLTGLAGATDSSTVTLDLTIGASTSASASGAEAVGLNLSIGLAVDVTVSLLGLGSVSLSLPDTSGGNLVDLQLARTTADAAGSGAAGSVSAELK